MSDIGREGLDFSQFNVSRKETSNPQVKLSCNEWLAAKRNDGLITVTDGVNVINHPTSVTSAEAVVDLLPRTGSPEDEASPCLIISLGDEMKEGTPEQNEAILRDALEQQAKAYPSYEIAVYYQPDTNKAFVIIGKGKEVRRVMIRMPRSKFIGHTHPTSVSGETHEQRVADLSGYIDRHAEDDPQANLFLLESSSNHDSSDNGGLSLVPSIPDLRNFIQRTNIEHQLGKHTEIIASEFGTTHIALPVEVDAMSPQEHMFKLNWLERQLDKIEQADMPARERVKWIIDNFNITFSIDDQNIREKIVNKLGELGNRIGLGNKQEAEE